MQISKKQKAALVAVCDALLPSVDGKQEDLQGYWKRNASDLQIAEQIINLVGQLSERDQREMQQVLSLLSSPLLGFTWWGPLKGAQRLTLKQVEKMLRAWSNHRLSDLRKGFNSLKKLSALLYFGASPSGTNPNWNALNYQPLKSPSSSSLAQLPLLNIPSSGQVDCDVVVIGSGAGGGVAAAVVAAAGKKVIVVEKGDYLSYGQFTNQEIEMMNRLYEAKGLLTSLDGGLTLLAGACLGGGTTVNWAGAFRTPEYILEEWAKEHGNPHFLSRTYSDGFDFVEKRNHITSDLLRHNPQNERLFSGAKKLDYKIGLIPRNMKRPSTMDTETFWRAQGFSPLGDRHGSKQGSVETFLRDAVAHGAEILVNTAVEKVLIEKGTAVGVLAQSRKGLVTIRAKKVILAAGAIHSPAILKRSGLKHPEIGNNLYVHPTVAVSAIYENEMNPWYGPMMSAVCDQFTRVNGNYGFKLETPPVHPGLIAAVLPWEDGHSFKKEMLNAAHTGTFIVLTRDKHGGRVTLNKKGQAEINYSLHHFDKIHLLKGIKEAAKIHKAAGASRITILHNQALTFPDHESDFETFLKSIEQRKWTTNRFPLFSAHQMGTCRMGGSDSRHPVKPNGETREVKNLFVADGSAFPSASGANPMLSIQALAYWVARGVVG